MTMKIIMMTMMIMVIMIMLMMIMVRMFIVIIIRTKIIMIMFIVNPPPICTLIIMRMYGSFWDVKSVLVTWKELHFRFFTLMFCSSPNVVIKNGSSRRVCGQKLWWWWNQANLHNSATRAYARMCAAICPNVYEIYPNVYAHIPKCGRMWLGKNWLGGTARVCCYANYSCLKSCLLS